MCKTTKKMTLNSTLRIGTNLAYNLYMVIKMHLFYKYVPILSSVL